MTMDWQPALRRHGLIAAIGLVLAPVAVEAEGFLTLLTQRNVLDAPWQVSITGTTAPSVTFVVVTRWLDLSVASTPTRLPSGPVACRGCSCRS